jgi:hypothetical protein
MKFSSAILLFLVASPVARATLIVSSLSKEGIVVCADRLETDSLTGERSTRTKLLKANEQTAFAAFGDYEVYLVYEQGRKDTIFSVFDIAQAELSSSPGQPSPALLDRLVKRVAKEYRTALRQKLRFANQWDPTRQVEFGIAIYSTNSSKQPGVRCLYVTRTGRTEGDFMITMQPIEGESLRAAKLMLLGSGAELVEALQKDKQSQVHTDPFLRELLRKDGEGLVDSPVATVHRSLMSLIANAGRRPADSKNQHVAVSVECDCFLVSSSGSVTVLPPR